MGGELKLKISGRKNKEDERPSGLAEVTFTASLDEIDELIDFLKYTKERHIYQRDNYKTKSDHTHYQDYRREFNKERPESDFIVVTYFDE